ncbi:MAG: hypothetical protein LBF97_02860 [Elusimicrobiota bacterium]|jgi:hypothetical protein|nr:hypothetical protein [Elusimicrobiota bacterium]
MLAETFPELANMTTSQINTINVNGGGVSLIFTQDLLSKEAMSYLDQSTFDKVAELIKIRDTNLDDIFAEIDLANVDIKDFDIKADVNHYRKSEINDKLANKANTNLDNVAQTDFDNLANVNHFTKTETNTLLAEKGNIDLSNIPTFQNAISNNSANDLTIDENGKIFHTGGGSVGNVGIFTTQSYLTSAVDAISIIQINTLN